MLAHVDGVVERVLELVLVEAADGWAWALGLGLGLELAVGPVVVFDLAWESIMGGMEQMMAMELAMRRLPLMMTMRDANVAWR